MGLGHTEEDVVRLFVKRPLLEDLGIHPRRSLKDIRRSAYRFRYRWRTLRYLFPKTGL